MKVSCIIVYLYAFRYACVHMNPLLMDVGVSKWEDGCVCVHVLVCMHVLVVQIRELKLL